jgi:hypothetical protein
LEKKCHQKHKGGRNELSACVWLLNEGYEVFRNVSQHGLVDVVAINREGKAFFFDIKSVLIAKSGHFSGGKLTEAQIEMGVIALWILPDGTFYINWKNEFGPPSRSIPCKKCNIIFTPHHHHRLFCSQNCKTAFTSDRIRDLKQLGRNLKQIGTRQ